jgi:hypothetical protein
MISNFINEIKKLHLTSISQKEILVKKGNFRGD